MGQLGMTHERIVENFVLWANQQEDVRAAFIIGSRARVDHPADEWSDTDIVMFTRAPERYETSNDWFRQFGDVWATLTSRTVGGEPERLVLYDGGRQVDFVLQDSAVLEDVGRMIESGALPDTIRRGVRVLLDKDGHLVHVRALSPSSPAPRHPLALVEFQGNVEGFLLSVVYVAKQLRRDELVVAKSADSQVKLLLIQMLEWYTRAVRGWDYDTWHAGRFIREWVEPSVYEALSATYAPLDLAASWRALLASIDLYGLLASQTAARLGFSYPSGVERAVTDHVKGLAPGTLNLSG